MKISLQNIEYKKLNLQKTNQQKASGFSVPENTTSSLNVISNYNKANINFNGRLTSFYNQLKEKKEFYLRLNEFEKKLRDGTDENGNQLFERKDLIYRIIPHVTPWNIDLVGKICFSKEKDEKLFENNDDFISAIHCLHEDNLEFAEKAFFPKEEKLSQFFKKPLDLFIAISCTNEENVTLSEKLIFGKNEYYEQMVEEYNKVNQGSCITYMLPLLNDERDNNHFVYRPFSEISPRLFKETEFIADILNATNKDNMALAEKLCFEKEIDGNDTFHHKKLIYRLLKASKNIGNEFIEKLCFTDFKLSTMKQDAFIAKIIAKTTKENLNIAKEFLYGTKENGSPLFKNKELILDILQRVESKDVKKQNDFIDLLKQNKIPETSIEAFFNEKITKEEYEKAMGIIGKDKLFSYNKEQLYTAVKFAPLYKQHDISKLSMNDKKMLLANILEQNKHYFENNQTLHYDFPLIPTDSTSYSNIITSLVNSLDLKKEKISTQDELTLNNALFSLSETLSSKVSNPSETDKISENLNQIFYVLPEIEPKEEYSQDEFLEVMQKIVQNPKYKKLNDSDKRILLIASLFCNQQQTENEEFNYNSFNAFVITQKLNLTEQEHNNLYLLIKNQDWFDDITNHGLNIFPIWTPSGELIKDYNAEEDDEKIKTYAYNLQYQNLFELSKVLAEAKLDITKKDEKRKRKEQKVFENISYKINENIQELKNTQPLLPVTPIPSNSRIKQAITKVYENGRTNLPGIYQDKRGMIIIYYNEVENDTWEKIGFPKGSISKGIISKDIKGKEINTGNIHFFVHGLDESTNLSNFDAFLLPDSDALLSVSYAERPESKYRFFRTQGVIIDSQYVHGGGSSDGGSGCKKTIDDFIKFYAFLGSPKHEERKFISDLIKKNLNLSKGQYKKLIEKNNGKPFTEMDPQIYQEKIIKTLATINSHTRFGERNYNEMYVSNPKVMAVYAYPSDDKVKNVMNFVKHQEGYIKKYALEKDIPLFVFGKE